MSRKPAHAKRIPDSAMGFALSGKSVLIDVNACKNPTCKNFGVAAYPGNVCVGKSASSPNELYAVTSSAKLTHQLHCLACNEYIPLKSNRGIAEEYVRQRGYLPALKTAGCPDTVCPNHNIPVTAGSRFYHSKGKTSIGSPRLHCLACKKSFSLAQKSTHRQRLTHKNRDIFHLLVNKSSLAAIVDFTNISYDTLYRKLNFIQKQCLTLSTVRELKLLQGLEAKRVYLSCDRQTYIVNWSGRKDKRNVQLQAIGTADAISGYVFGMTLDFDAALDSKEIEAQAVDAGDYLAPFAMRRFARLWLDGDYALAVAESKKTRGKRSSSYGLDGQVDTVYLRTEARDDVEAASTISETDKLPSTGMQTRLEYTLYAHFYHLSTLFSGVEKVRFFVDQESGIRAAIMAAFKDRIKAGTCEAFFVSISKETTQDEKRKAIAKAKVEFESFRDSQGLSDAEAMVELMRDRIKFASPKGKWSDKWVTHPLPNMSEPEKRVCWLTDHGQFSNNDDDQRHLANLYLMASLNPIDRFFNQLRRKLAYLERGIATASKAGRMWHGYQPYKPEHVQLVLDIYKTYYNYCLVSGKDKKTPAMRLGLAKGPLSIEDILYLKNESLMPQEAKAA